VVVIDTAPQAKVDRMRALGAELVPTPFNACWDAMEKRVFPGMEGTFVHPFDDHDFIAGNATMGLEILEDCPEVATVIGAMGGGGLLTALGSAFKALKPLVRVIGAEPETAAPLARSLAEDGPREFEGWRASFVDGAGGRSVFPRMWQRLRPVIDGAVVVSLDETRAAMRMMAEKSRIISEGAGALALAAALKDQGRSGTTVCVVSGGNIDLKTFCELVA
jgi:threonine dehydratase